MLIPSIDLMGGRIVQLVQGETLKHAFDDFEYWIERFSSYPLVQLTAPAAAMRQGENSELIHRIAHRLPCQVGGGIRDTRAAQAMLEAGARRVIVGSALFRPAPLDPHRPASLVDREFVSALAEAIGPERLVASVDTKAGRVAVKGWKESIGLTAEEAMSELEPFSAAFLYTHIDKEGTMQGFPFEVACRLRQATGRQLIVAGGIRERAEIDALHEINVDAVAGMAVYTGVLQA